MSLYMSNFQQGVWKVKFRKLIKITSQNINVVKVNLGQENSTERLMTTKLDKMKQISNKNTSSMK